ncbi:MAG: non-heme iron oxygenase ferredoxin subunit [Acidobacteria bacterium]|nr:MAG: non-heme iron oxygenase ferredoxin subunit [Acidobacteriota bacterium]
MGEFVKVAKTSEIGPGEAKTVEVKGTVIGLFNVDGQYYAIENTCTHVGGPLAEGMIDGDEVTCPWHGARFKISTGEVLGPPAQSDVATYTVRVQGDDIEIEI